MATVPNDQIYNNQEHIKLNSLVPSLSAEHSINDSSSIHSDDSILHSGQDGSESALSPTSNSNSSETCDDECKKLENSTEPIAINNTPNTTAYQQVPTEQCSPYSSEMNTDYATGSHYAEYYMQTPQTQHQPPYYVYHPYSEYQTMTPAGTTHSPQQATQISSFYPGYSGIPYAYADPNITYATYAPVQTQQTGNGTMPAGQQQAILSSPQHQSTILASYQTPTQPQHQLYIAASNITPPSSISPNETTPGSTTSASTTIGNEQLCNSPQQTNNGLVPCQQTSAGPIYPSPYLIYSTPSPYMTPQAFQSPIPSQPAYAMMYSSTYGQQNQTPTQNNMSLSTRYNNNNSNNNNNQKYNRSNRYNKRNNNQKQNTSNQINSNGENAAVLNQTPNCIPPANNCEENLLNNNHEFNEQNNYANYSQYIPQQQQQQQQFQAPLLNYPFEYDPNFYMQNFGMGYDYNLSTTYGEDYGDEYDDNVNDDDNEQLACQVCRGRRMCFCYFLKVRYYKFPSFFDLVDHQYKKWRSNMLKTKKQM